MSTRLEEYDGAPEIEGVVAFDEGWYLLAVAPESHAVLLRLLDGITEPIKPAAKPHVSVIKEEAPSRNKEDWGTLFVGEAVRVRYNPTLRDDNGMHFWVDCYSPRLCEMREHFALTTLKRNGVYLVNFHLTIGRRKKPLPKSERRPRAELRLNPGSHIDVETGMQHL